MTIFRRSLLAVTAAGVTLTTIGTRAFASLPPLAKKDTYKIGFAQTESYNPRRLTKSKSMQDEAKRLGYQIV